jgi:hypothetical protein
MKTRTSPGSRAARPQERVNATISADSTIGTSKCRACLKSLPPGSGLRYCSARCRLRSWAVRELAKALQECTVDGLRSELRASIAEIVKEEK